MILSTTHTLEGRQIAEYKGLVSGQAILGANLFRDFFAAVRDIVGGRAAGYEKVLRDGRDQAVADMVAEATAKGATAIVGIDIDYATVGDKGSMLMVSVSGTAVTLR